MDTDDLLHLPSWHHGKLRNLSWKSYGILLSDFCGNLPDFRQRIVHCNETVCLFIVGARLHGRNASLSQLVSSHRHAIGKSTQISYCLCH